eukprot:sb/3466002/
MFNRGYTALMTRRNIANILTCFRRVWAVYKRGILLLLLFRKAVMVMSRADVIRFQLLRNEESLTKFHFQIHSRVQIPQIGVYPRRTSSSRLTTHQLLHPTVWQEGAIIIQKMFASLQGIFKFGDSAPEQQKTPEPQPPTARRGSAAVVEHKDQVRGRPGAGGSDKIARMATVESTAAGAPNIEFVKSGIIDLTIHKAENLEKCDLFGKGDPYVVVCVNGHRVHKTAVKHSTQQPTFNESKQCFVLDVTKSKMVLAVYDEDKFGADTYLGEVHINLVRLKNTFFESDFLKLSPPPGWHASFYLRVGILFWLSRLCFSANLVKPKFYGLPKLCSFRWYPDFYRKVRANEGCHAQIRRRATKGE